MGEKLTLNGQRKLYSQLDQELQPHPEDRLDLVDPKTTNDNKILINVCWDPNELLQDKIQTVNNIWSSTSHSK